ncbi:MAG: NUDIX domain-containing protein [Nisaea sp.]|jgi:8-oxo-dGTP pyrophosphatase MutT (NUDIX family)|uniref:NUDIX hydrolase n=1 Tax=Nisaea sp. TaxID=2024842 RepID=UPI001B15462D|nr:NUDIX domain-containing protein [Nisaea sp.]MBO6560830.1 NUDIX domain-containing protein [Nisaea sp.]
MHRVGIIPFDIRDDLIAVLFVTSQTRGRWILPKGKRKKDETQTEACLREGFEEAGVKGVVLNDFPMTQVITKLTSSGKVEIPVTYYPFLVTEQFDEWPEKALRQRHWALLEDAPRVAYREDYLPVLRQFEALSNWIRETARQHKQPQQAELTPAQ